MAATDAPNSAVTGGPGATDTGDPVGATRVPSLVRRKSAAVRTWGVTAADFRTDQVGTDGRRPDGGWPDWARNDLAGAIELAAHCEAGTISSAQLYRDWYRARLSAISPMTWGRPLAGLYRAAHVGNDTRRVRGEVQVLDRHDVIGPDGWWRTWGDSWTPPRTRPGSVRLLMSPNPHDLALFVRVITERLRPLQVPWSLACATDPRRVRQSGAATLDVRSPRDLPPGLVEALAPLMHPARPPLSLPLAPGIGAVTYPDNGMTFGEHRCHLVALGLRRANDGRDPLMSVASVFRAHGIDPATPFRARSPHAPQR